MREAWQAVTAMRASVATQTSVRPLISLIELRRTLVRAPDVCDHHERSCVMEPGRKPRSTEHACRAYDVSDGLLDSTARSCRGGRGARLRVIVAAGAQSHSCQSQIAVARRRRAAEVLLR